ncbi:MAG: hypothetical protein A2785_00780 [Candidatus Chisholmbacteria bacterium RIFCSPHIGHO2_01_FULL_49_18]|uniref:Uncharacterized protein n=2 Tax=Candidatus Chisholmiibacteriota TaxID=1817900 RepID=A0A1G1VL37_9BACT|nr:MAG: hypothetical protein A2785_00780 [Candidatus Chisholmbacteria bacterium RIFCSPHIGHO2_01_FULL_49_18]OGY22204.1 MAG: hypothetical protein A3A65_04910 [Candidatus Chisholmbacteria bacterium RIFCSPLOWO2_01_FULL_49_14]
MIENPGSRIISFFADIPAHIRRVKDAAEVERKNAFTRSFLARYGEQVKTVEELRKDSYIAVVVPYATFYAFAYKGSKQNETGLMINDLEYLRDPGQYVAAVLLDEQRNDFDRQLIIPMSGDEALAWLNLKLSGPEILEGDIYRITAPELIERIEEAINDTKPVGRA